MRLDIDKARHAPVLKSQQQFTQWRKLMAAWLQIHVVLEVVLNGSPLLSLPTTVSVQASRTAAMPLIEAGAAIGPPGKDAERKIDRQKLLFAHSALMHACVEVPLALAAVNSVPMPNAQEAWRKIEEALMPRSTGELALKEQELTQFQQWQGETVASYSSRMQELVNQLAMLGSQHQDEALMSRFTSGLRSFEKSRRETLVLTCKNLTEAINKAVSLETSDRLEKQLKSGGRQQQPQSESLGSAHAASFRGRKGGGKQKRGKDRVCYNCSQPGHLAKDCPSPPKKGGGGGGGKGSRDSDLCTWCGKPNHTESDCRSKKAGRPRASQGQASQQRGRGRATTAVSFMDDVDAHVAELIVTSQPHSAHAAMLEHKGAQVPEVLLDSGSSHNMMKPEVQLRDVQPLVGTSIRTAGQQALNNPSVGSLHLQSAASATPLSFTNVLTHDKLTRNLLSVSCLVDRSEVKECVFDKHGARLVGHNGEIILTGSRRGGLYLLDTASANAASVEEQQDIHARLGHIGRTALHKLIQSGAVQGIEKIVLRQSIDCSSCKEGKAIILPFHDRLPEVYRATRSLQCLHADLHGPIKTLSLSGAAYTLVIVDEYADFVWIATLKTKDEAAREIKRIILQINTEHGVFPARFHSDRGGEFTLGHLACCETQRADLVDDHQPRR